ncbi:MAG TPA: lytic murein transglycosylase [Balneolaceae bacterium]|nr:lytic murein transglycosylase [Balneolaceae bacterium]
MIYKILTIALFSSLFVTISAFCGVEYVRTQPAESFAAVHRVSPDSLSSNIKYEKTLASLVSDFNEMGFDIDKLLQDPRFEIYEDIDDRFRKSAERKSPGLDEYKQILGFEHKSAQIVDFIKAHYDQLEKAEKTYGISKFVISAIIGVETAFGEYIGEYNPFNAYVSMYAVGYRSDFAKAQLKHLMIFTQKNHLDVLSLKSSYAGAMSFAQFIPYSLNKWFVGDELYNMDNNILSVANYLAYFKERTGDIETAVLRYNPSDLYRDAVLDLAEAGKKNFLTSI